MPFAKVDSGLHRNAKIVAAGPDAREVFVLLLCLNAELDTNGRMPSGYVKPEYLSRQLDRAVTACVTAVTACVEHRLIAFDGPDTVLICGWNEEWSKKPKTNAERQQSWRDRNRNGAEVTNNGNNASEKIRVDQSRSDQRTLITPVKPARSTRPVLTAPELDAIGKVLASLEQYSGVRYEIARAGKPTANARLVADRLRDGITEMELRAVNAYCALDSGLGWQGKQEMRKYLRPETLYGPKTIDKYLDPARSWFRQQYGEEAA